MSWDSKLCSHQICKASPVIILDQQTTKDLNFLFWYLKWKTAKNVLNVAWPCYPFSKTSPFGIMSQVGTEGIEYISQTYKSGSANNF